MSLIKSILIDDEEDAIQSLEWKICRYCPGIEIVASVSDPLHAIETIENINPDCIFIDIKMPLLSGFDILESLHQKKITVIITSAFEDYALKAIKFSVFEYLLKPIDKDDLVRVYNKLCKRIKLATNNKQSRIQLCVNGVIYFFKKNEIVLLKAEGNYTTIFLTDNRKLFLSKTLKEVIKPLPTSCFFRIHKSYCINLEHVQEYKKSQGGVIRMSNGEYVSISRDRKITFLAKMD
ncbi:LytTR family DNA-binding domain-containing protein [Aquimarina sp. RZ0]|uniref:LytR/AlgR family response regulator transcription factor n=1 Tax=Aquimarina sp. RZ0 TaxID=2607730 RepID=UPI0011F1BF6A|nr:LytTR family DNA-binding domain-containing protein [Aquimarina sp. RZ0]KAA1247279.1 response regulator transcription factor [Aquimarina sp. RZ0]